MDQILKSYEVIYKIGKHSHGKDLRCERNKPEIDESGNLFICRLGGDGFDCWVDRFSRLPPNSGENRNVDESSVNGRKDGSFGGGKAERS